MEKLSTTDVKCYWAGKKKLVEEQYEAKPLLDTPCFSSKVFKAKELTAEQQKECFDSIIRTCPGSALALHL